MYARYEKTAPGAGSSRYQLAEEISLFGCNNGFIPWLLERQTPRGRQQPYAWHLNLESALNACPEYRGSTLVIDLKPKQRATNLSLYELIDCWGYSNEGWTPILLYLNSLFVDANPKGVNRSDFTLQADQIDGPIYEFFRLDGSVDDGKLIGTWNPPGASPTNAALLWPDALAYFIKCIKECTPDVLN